MYFIINEKYTVKNFLHENIFQKNILKYPWLTEPNAANEVFPTAFCVELSFFTTIFHSTMN